MSTYITLPITNIEAARLAVHAAHSATESARLAYGHTSGVATAGLVAFRGALALYEAAVEASGEDRRAAETARGLCPGVLSAADLRTLRKLCEPLFPVK